MNNTIASAVLVVVAVTTAHGQAPGRSQRPPSGASPMATPAILKHQLSNGLTVWIVEQHELPVVQMSLQVPTGTDADPPGRYGIASLTSAMLTKGAGSRSAVEIADALDVLLANLSASTGVDSSFLRLYVPVAGLAEALPLMADVWQRPTFPQPELDRVRRQHLQTLRGARDDPDAIAALVLARGLYGPSQRNAAAQIGTMDSLEAVTAEDLGAFHKSAYRPGNSTLLVVGDVEADRVLPLLETYFGKWRPAGAPGVAGEPAPEIPPPPRRLMLVDLPDAPQSRILVGGVGRSSSMADFFPTRVLNAVLKGRFGSARNPTLRDYTAGVRSGFEIRKSAGPFVVAAAAQGHKTAESLREMLNELTNVLKGIPADELARAKDDSALEFSRTFEATGRISSRLQALESLVAYNLPDDYYSQYEAAIRSVGADDVRRVADQYFRPDHLVIAIVGDRKTIERPLRALGVGAITAVSIDEVFARAR
ncbi:MAG: pitrilysin family protein [Vicinamibacterales bacterium]